MPPGEHEISLRLGRPLLHRSSAFFPQNPQNPPSWEMGWWTRRRKLRSFRQRDHVREACVCCPCWRRAPCMPLPGVDGRRLDGWPCQALTGQIKPSEAPRLSAVVWVCSAPLLDAPFPIVGPGAVYVQCNARPGASLWQAFARDRRQRTVCEVSGIQRPQVAGASAASPQTVAATRTAG